MARVWLIVTLGAVACGSLSRGLPLAHRDKSQGFGFVYIDVAKLLAQKHETEPVVDSGALSINLNRDPYKSPAPNNPDVKSNLDRLSALHHKLHVLMEELNNLTKKKK